MEHKSTCRCELCFENIRAYNVNDADASMVKSMHKLQAHRDKQKEQNRQRSRNLYKKGR